MNTHHDRVAMQIPRRWPRWAAALTLCVVAHSLAHAQNVSFWTSKDCGIAAVDALKNRRGDTPWSVEWTAGQAGPTLHELRIGDYACPAPDSFAAFTLEQLGKIASARHVGLHGLPWTTQETRNGIARLARLEGLQSLTIEVVSLDKACFHEMTNLKQLQQLHLRRDRGEPDVPELGDWVFEPLSAMGGLRELALTDIKSIEGTGIDRLAALKSLTTLDLSGTAIGDAATKALATLPALEKLDLRETRVSPVGLETLAASRTLKSVILSGMDQPTGRALGQWPRLEVLGLDVKELYDAMADGVARLGGLRSLQIAGQWRGSALAKCLAPLKELQRLGVTGFLVGTPGDSVLQAVGQRTGLRSLELRVIHGVTPEGLSHLASLKDLEELSFGGGFASRITNGRQVWSFEWRFTAKAIAELKKLPALKRLCLSHVHVTADGLKALSSLRHLRRLELTHFEADGEIFPALAPMDELEVLVIDRRPTAEAIPLLGKLRNLKRLELQWCDLDVATAKRITETLPKGTVLRYGF